MSSQQQKQPVVQCPDCRTEVVPKKNGRCPSCGAAHWPSQLSVEEMEADEMQRELRLARTRIEKLEASESQLRRRLFWTNLLGTAIITLAILRALLR